MNMDLIKVKRHFVMQAEIADDEKCVYEPAQTQNIVEDECYKSDGSSSDYFDNRILDRIVKNEPEDIEIDYDYHSIKCEENEIKVEYESLNSSSVISGNPPYSEDEIKFSNVIKLERDYISLPPDLNSVQHTESSIESIDEDLKSSIRCNYKTISKEFSKKHMQKRKCNFETNHCDKVKEHIATKKRTVQTFCCESCSYKTNTCQLLVEHYQKLHPMSFKCANCNYVTQNNNEFKEHVTEHEKTVQYSCEKCSYETSNKCLFDQHLLAHDLATLICFECNYQTENRCDFEQHLTMHVINAQAFSCSFCNYKNKSKQSMETHYATCHDLTFKCSKCDHETKNMSLMKDHLIGHQSPPRKKMRTRNGDVSDEPDDNRPMIQKHRVCQFETGNVDGSKDDEKQTEDALICVSEMYLYKCDSCRFETKHLKTLQRHRARHYSGMSRFYCKHCEYNTFFEKFYREHLLSHGMKTQARPVIFECGVCYYKAKDKNDLKIHSLKHRDVSKLLDHKCAFCDGKGSICNMQHRKSTVTL